MVDLSSAGPFDRAFAINQRGEIVGHQNVESLLWRDGVLVSLSPLFARDLNDRGVAAGVIIAGSDPHAAIWRDGTVVDLGVPPGAVDSIGRAINRHGVVVGESITAAVGNVQGFRWQDGTIELLPTLIPSGASFALDVNDHGVIVGESMSNPDVIGGEPHAVVWLGDRLIDLGTLPGGAVSVARTINDRGVIAGFSFDATGRGQAVVWVPQ
jgi:probable HAF family extracellular repeat protein